MSVSVDASLKLNLGTDKYDITLGIPAVAPDKDNPYIFKVDSVEGTNKNTLLGIAVGDDKHYYAKVAPPKSALNSVNEIDDVSITVINGWSDKSHIPGYSDQDSSDPGSGAGSKHQDAQGDDTGQGQQKGGSAPANSATPSKMQKNPSPKNNGE
ncbi:hypothetical protein [Thalassotalea fusca]